MTDQDAKPEVETVAPAPVQEPVAEPPADAAPVAAGLTPEAVQALIAQAVQNALAQKAEAEAKAAADAEREQWNRDNAGAIAAHRAALEAEADRIATGEHVTVRITKHGHGKVATGGWDIATNSAATFDQGSTPTLPLEIAQRLEDQAFAEIQ